MLMRELTVTDRITLVDLGDTVSSCPSADPGEYETYDFEDERWEVAEIHFGRAVPRWFSFFEPPLPTHKQVFAYVRDFLCLYPDTVGFVARNSDEFGVLRKVSSVGVPL